MRYCICPICNNIYVKKSIKKIKGEYYCPFPECAYGTEMGVVDSEMAEIVKVLNAKKYFVKEAHAGNVQEESVYAIYFFDKQDMPAFLPNGWERRIIDNEKIYSISLVPFSTVNKEECQKYYYEKMIELIDYCYSLNENLT